MAGIVSFAEALNIVQTHAGKLGPRDAGAVELLRSTGRVLAQDVSADRDQPPFDRATRDGFAVQAAAWSSGQKLRVIGQIRAGDNWNGGEVPFGSAVEIMTGAPVPAGIDAVAMVEHAVLEEDHVSAGAGSSPLQRHPLAPGDNIVPRGSEAHLGDVLLPKGTVMGAAEIAVAATCGQAELQVRKRPGVAICATGDELVGITEVPLPHQIRNSNSYGLAALVELAGGCPGRLEPAADVRGDVWERIAQGRMWDLLILSGGVSAGKYDLVEEVLAEFGAEFFFTGVKMQPGKPVVFGRLPKLEHASGAGPECYFFGLPGNPVSTQVTFHCFVEPFLHVLAGAPWAGPRFAQATLAQDIPSKPGLTRVLPARLTPALDRSEVRLVSWQGSGDLAANARANCYAVVPAGTNQRAGDTITVLLR
jgi:molybdopterin molybdotransferase